MIELPTCIISIICQAGSEMFGSVCPSPQALDQVVRLRCTEHAGPVAKIPRKG